MEKGLLYKTPSVTFGIKVSKKQTYSREEYVALGKQRKQV